MKILIKNKINLHISCIVTEYETRNSLFANYIILIVKHGHIARTAWGETHTLTQLIEILNWILCCNCVSFCLSLPLSPSLCGNVIRQIIRHAMHKANKSNQNWNRTQNETKPNKRDKCNSRFPISRGASPAQRGGRATAAPIWLIPAWHRSLFPLSLSLPMHRLLWLH